MLMKLAIAWHQMVIQLYSQNIVSYKNKSLVCMKRMSWKVQYSTALIQLILFSNFIMEDFKFVQIS